MTNMEPQSSTSNTLEGSPTVLIVGAGLARLLLGIYPEEAMIPYQIFEHASEIKPLGLRCALARNFWKRMSQTEKAIRQEELMACLISQI
ncbi:hypothetical protein BG015_004721 [Linnemannia schmuckeri]|uniref:Uncharacterized protein n=1 Tax=Linnemannia schmuckeri TaxID=64567 RepID=A0A9P5S7E5_9FUNG|nr:hypothetical protein BG015_004721 [Linnemannia schmuckeri]